MVWRASRSWVSSLEPGRSVLLLVLDCAWEGEALELVKTESRRDQYHSHSQSSDSWVECLRVAREGYSRWTMQWRVSRRVKGRERKGVWVPDGLLAVGDEGRDWGCDCD